MQISVFTIKVILEHNHTHLCMYYNVIASVLHEATCGTLITVAPARCTTSQSDAIITQQHFKCHAHCCARI